MIKPKNNQGFSYVELIVSISIIALMAAIFLANYKSANRSAELNAAANQLASDLRLVQSYVLGAKKNEKNGSTVPAGGWGIRFRSQPPNNVLYNIFADSNLSGGSNKPKQYDSSDFDYATINFPGNGRVTISAMSGFTDAPNTENSIVFLPPDPVVYLDGAVNAAPVTITLREATTGLTKNVTVNSFGLIDVE